MSNRIGHGQQLPQISNGNSTRPGPSSSYGPDDTRPVSPTGGVGNYIASLTRSSSRGSSDHGTYPSRRGGSQSSFVYDAYGALPLFLQKPTPPVESIGTTFNIDDTGTNPKIVQSVKAKNRGLNKGHQRGMGTHVCDLKYIDLLESMHSVALEAKKFQDEEESWD